MHIAQPDSVLSVEHPRGEGFLSLGGGGPWRLRCHPARPLARSLDPHLARPLQTPSSLTSSTTRSWWLAEAEKVVPSGVGAVQARCEAVRVSDGRPVTAVARHEATERAGKRPFFRDGKRGGQG